MPSTYTTRNRAEKQAAGENSNTWGTRLNTNLIDMFDAALDGRTAFTLSTTKTLTTADGSADEARMRFIDITGGTGGTVTIPNVEKWYLVRNGSSGDVIFTTGSGTTATLKTGAVTAIVSTGANVVYAEKIDVATQAVGTLAVANGGTGVTSSTGTGSVVRASGPTLVTPDLGTPSAGVATNLTGLPLTTGVTGTLPVANGGTGTTTSTGTGSVVLSADPTFTGTLTAATITASGRATTAGLTSTDTVIMSGANAYIRGNATTGVLLNNSADTINILILENGGAAKFVNVGTTASAANAFLDSGASNSLLRSTSSLRYKTDVETVDPAYNKVLGLRPVYYKSLASADNPVWGWWGLIAEEVAAIDPRLVHYGYQEDQYETVEGDNGPEKRVKAGEAKRPDGVQYERLAVLLLDVVQRQEKRIAALEAKLI